MDNITEQFELRKANIDRQLGRDPESILQGAELRVEKAYESGTITDEEYEKAYEQLDDNFLSKAKSGVYANTSENRKKGRVGQKYGSKKGKEEGGKVSIEEDPSGKFLVKKNGKYLGKDGKPSKDGYHDAHLFSKEEAEKYGAKSKKEPVQKENPKGDEKNTAKDSSKENSELKNSFDQKLSQVGRLLNKKPYSDVTADAVEDVRMQIKNIGSKLGMSNKDIDNKITESKKKFATD